MPSFSKYLKLIRSQKQKFSGLSYWGLIKYYKRWSQSFNAQDEMHEMPWMTFEVTDFLQGHSNNQMRVFEYGSGSSTLFWAKRVKEVVSIEHDLEWCKKVEKELAQRKFSNVQLLFIPPEKRVTDKVPEIADPFGYSSDDENFTAFSFESYVKKINDFEDSYFDYVVVDGRSRPSCIAASIKKVKQGGYLMLDNSERVYYLANTLKMLPTNNWKRMDFCGPIPGSMHFSQTTLFKRLS